MKVVKRIISFHSPDIEDDTIGENDRNEFLKSIEIEKVNVNPNIR